MSVVQLQLFNLYQTPGAVVGSGLTVDLWPLSYFSHAPRDGSDVPFGQSPTDTKHTDANGKVSMTNTAVDAYVCYHDASGYPWWFTTRAAWVGDGNVHPFAVTPPISPVTQGATGFPGVS